MVGRSDQLVPAPAKVKNALHHEPKANTSTRSGHRRGPDRLDGERTEPARKARRDDDQSDSRKPTTGGQQGGDDTRAPQGADDKAEPSKRLAR
ncbi:hypothetical protein GCM10018779_66760 [Streptomyces griseocarneus]|nr:hypothetical protein GCM10018779_66760 [Streptomyces griseocarneus]